MPDIIVSRVSFVKFHGRNLSRLSQVMSYIGLIVLIILYQLYSVIKPVTPGKMPYGLKLCREYAKEMAQKERYISDRKLINLSMSTGRSHGPSQRRRVIRRPRRLVRQCLLYFC